MIPAAAIFDAAGLSFRTFRDTVGGHSRHVRAALEGPISAEQADRWCCRLGLHPAEVYGAATWAAALEAADA